ncbi:MAG TPA: hypothetical protein VMH23_06200, partial [Bacteroidota bacterium]|nr:hypothetical protein [Bacteroidota bacterium]
LEITGLASFASHHPYDLPAAQRKLLTAACAVASGSPFMAFDEPSAGLSQIERSIFENLLTHLRERGRGLLVVSHDLGLLLPFASKALILSEGKNIYCGEASIVLQQEGLLRKAGLRLPMTLRLAALLGVR